MMPPCREAPCALECAARVIDLLRFDGHHKAIPLRRDLD
jgi:hypothetical protein